jgi:hypothetical protein
MPDDCTVLLQQSKHDANGRPGEPASLGDETLGWQARSRRKRSAPHRVLDLREQLVARVGGGDLPRLIPVIHNVMSHLLVSYQSYQIGQKEGKQSAVIFALHKKNRQILFYLV